jgi:hypothetical protein
MPNCMALGQAAGVAAALCIQEDTSPRDLDIMLLKEWLLSEGAIV